MPSASRSHASHQPNLRKHNGKVVWCAIANLWIYGQAVLGNSEITEEDIENRNPSSTKYVFAGESFITASGGAAIGQKVFVNGIEESLLSVTIDGARQNKSALHHTGNVLLDPELLKRVEVSEGLAPADAGPGDLAGSISMPLTCRVAWKTWRYALMCVTSSTRLMQVGVLMASILRVSSP